MAVDWSYYNKPIFRKIDKIYLPEIGEGETMASQAVVAVNKLVYKWYNDGDVYDNVNSGMSGWANDLSTYANWLAKYTNAQPILVKIFECLDDSTYEDILKELADTILSKEYLQELSKKPKVSSVYEEQGEFKFSDEDEDD